MKKDPYKDLIERRCPVCRRLFVPAPYHVYKHSEKMFCSYSCYNSFLNKKEQKTRGYNKIAKEKK